MIGKRVIRLGDPTSHGGVVVSAASNYFAFDKLVARLGDKATCPRKGHGACTIVEGDPLWSIDGRPVALEGHKTSCGALLISTMPQVLRSYEGMGESSTGAGAAAAAASARAAKARGANENPRACYDEHFVFQDETSGTPITGFTYGMKTSFGDHHGEAYEDGATVKAYSESPVPVQLIYAAQAEMGLRE